MKTGEMDASGEWAGGSSAPSGLFERPPAASKEERKFCVPGGKLLKGLNEVRVPLECAETADEPNDGRIECQSGFAAGGVLGARLEAARIHAVNDYVDLPSGEPLADEAFAEGMGDRMHAADAVVKEVANDPAMGGQLGGREFSVLAVQNAGASSGSGKESVDKRAEIMGVDNVRTWTRPAFGKRRANSPARARQQT